MALVCWLWARNGERSALGWCVYWCAAGFLCWLHVKYYAPSAVLAGLGVWHLWRDSATRFTPARYVTFGVLFLVGPALFCAFSISAFGNVLGGRGGGELNTDVSTAAEIFVGLHLDQVQGLFVQQPIFLPGLIALSWMIRRRHPLTVPWLVLYASLLVPNALQRMPYGGHVAPAGRFGWSAMWLWLIPLGIAPAGRGGRGAHTSAVRLIVLMGIAYQAALALQWVPEPQRLFNGLFPPQAWQPSLFPPDVMLSLPKFGLHGDIGYPPNVVWTFAAFSLIAAGFLHAPRLRYLLPAATVVFAHSVVLSRTRWGAPVPCRRGGTRRSTRGRTVAFIPGWVPAMVRCVGRTTPTGSRWPDHLFHSIRAGTRSSWLYTRTRGADPFRWWRTGGAPSSRGTTGKTSRPPAPHSLCSCSTPTRHFMMSSFAYAAAEVSRSTTSTFTPLRRPTPSLSGATPGPYSRLRTSTAAVERLVFGHGLVP